MTLRSILAVPCTCRNCGWTGVSGDCEAGFDGDLSCPACWPAEIHVEIHYNAHERNPTAAAGDRHG
jgi:hypothetical protein